MHCQQAMWCGVLLSTMVSACWTGGVGVGIQPGGRKGPLAAAVAAVLIRETRGLKQPPLVAILGPETVQSQLAAELRGMANVVSPSVVDSSHNYATTDFDRLQPLAIKISPSTMAADSTFWIAVRRCAGWPCKTEYAVKIGAQDGGYVAKRVSVTRIS